MLKLHTEKLCVNCPLPESYRKTIKQNLRDKQYTRLKDDPTAVKECAERRKVMAENPWMQGCPYFNHPESITIWF